MRKASHRRSPAPGASKCIVSNVLSNRRALADSRNAARLRARPCSLGCWLSPGRTRVRFVQRNSSLTAHHFERLSVLRMKNDESKVPVGVLKHAIELHRGIQPRQRRVCWVLVPNHSAQVAGKALSEPCRVFDDAPPFNWRYVVLKCWCKLIIGCLFVSRIEKVHPCGGKANGFRVPRVFRCCTLRLRQGEQIRDLLL
jgi:hypothetical protein